MLPPIRLPNVTDVVYDVLRRKIIDGNFAPGQQLNLKKLEDQLDVSRTPLKSALARLQTEGLVSVHPRRGTYVMEYEKRDIEECFEVRIALEAQALRHAFEPRNKDKLQEIIRLLEGMSTYYQDENTWQEQTSDFMIYDRMLHIQFMELSGNERMKQLYDYVNVQGYIAIMGSKFTYPDVLKTQAEHHAICEALLAHDLPALLEAARDHLQSAGQRAVYRLFPSDEDDS